MKLSEAGLAVFDMDSTLLQIECIDEIAELLGIKAEIAHLTERAMQGELDFEQSLRARVKLLAGAEVARFEQIFQPIPVMAGAQELIQWLQQLGWKTAVVSGGFTWFAERLKDFLDLDYALANSLAVEHGRLTGELAGVVVDAKAKADSLARLQRQWQIAPQQTLAVGDGANDKLLLQQAAVGIAFNAKATLREVATHSIDGDSLTLVKNCLSRHYGD